MRRCSKCKQQKPSDQFAWKSKAKGTRDTYCRTCRKEYGAQWYQANAASQIARVAANSARYYEAAQALIVVEKDVSCADCGRRYPPYVMDFDHVRGKKAMNVARMVNQRRSLKKIREEIAKCEVVCSNCHRIRTWTRRQYKASVA